MSKGEQYAMPGKYRLGSGRFTEKFGQDVAEYVNQMRPSASAFYKDGFVYVTVSKIIGLDGADFAFTGSWEPVETIPATGSPALLAAGAAALLLLIVSKR